MILALAALNESTRRRVFLLGGHLISYVEGRLCRTVLRLEVYRHGFEACLDFLNEMVLVNRNCGLVLLEPLVSRKL